MPSARFRRLTVITALTVLGTCAVAPGQAAADAVAAAQARVNALQSLARETTATLVEGTQQWEQDQSQLAAYTVRLGNSRRRIGALQVEVERQQGKVDTVVRELFMHGGRSGLHLAFTQRPEQVLDVLSAQHSLEIVTGNTAAVIDRAATTRLHLRTQEKAAADLVDRAVALTQASANRLASLNALADRTAAQLSSAQAQLDSALRQRAAREAARAARLRAAQARARAVVTVRVSSGAFCTNSSTSGQANGNLDPSSLCPLWMTAGHRLRMDAATAFNAMSQHHAQTVGSPLCVTDSYRSYSEQVSVYRRKPGLAAVPGTSEHGWGKAVDFCGGIERFGTPEHEWMKANAGRFGWYHPDWARSSGSRPEAWHWEFGG